MFSITKYLAEFGSSKEYANIEKQIASDFEMIEANTITLLVDVVTSNKAI
jgi:hypothetical protein